MPENKAPNYIIIAIVVITIAVLGFLVWRSKQTAKKAGPEEQKPSMQQVLENLTAPNTVPAIPDRGVLQSISAPKKSTPAKIDPKIINSLTAPAK
ncbi:MAG: hypothetical protein HYW89_01885 [Candidatus Sungiibacteriota bacterium]|uniref:Uncharacterized protein n=1 Tax=Candidatus Sungiibacteriota bacterium TaxID=2750080 RepID=A0A7T5USG0_9BACT|nr:MAG: hypothetical protein HYW89_01885 [Candidatus Sungbacteria bacterium]